MADGKSPLLPNSKGLIVYVGVLRQPKKKILVENVFDGDVKNAVAGFPGCVDASAQRMSSKLSDGKHAMHHYTNLALNVSFVCLADVSLGKGAPFDFLMKVEEQFHSHFTAEQVKGASEGGLQASFGESLKALVGANNGVVTADQRTAKLMDKVEAVSDNLHQATAKLMEREDRINDLAQRAEGVATSSLTLREEATALHRRVWWKNTRIWICAAVVVLVVVVLIVLDFTSG